MKPTFYLSSTIILLLGILFGPVSVKFFPDVNSSQSNTNASPTTLPNDTLFYDGFESGTFISNFWEPNPGENDSYLVVEDSLGNNSVAQSGRYASINRKKRVMELIMSIV